MSEPDTPAPRQPEPDREQLLADAIRVLTAAARLTRPVRQPAGNADGNGADKRWVESGQAEPADWAEFVTQALAGAAANVGSVEAVLAGRPGSWEAAGVRSLLHSTVGEGENYLLEHRTEPVVIDVFVDEILADLGIWDGFDQASQEIVRRYQEAGLLSTDSAPAVAGGEPATEEQERQADQLADLEERLDRLREQDWTTYGENLKAAVEAAARRRPGLRVPVIVNIDLNTYRPSGERPSLWTWGLGDQLLEEAITNTPTPGDGRPPLDRLNDGQDD